MDMLQILLSSGIAALVLSCFGFWMYVFFFSVGYGYSILGISALFLVVYRTSLTPLTLAMCAVLGLYGLRLGTFLLARGIKSASYKELFKNEVKSKVPFGVKLAIWLSVSLLYVCQMSPIAFRFVNKTGDDAFLIAGIALVALGFLTEWLSDIQKGAAKKKNPKSFVSTGLYRIVRCPNYLGELILWTGVFVSGISVCNSVLQWVFAALGYVGIIYVMFSGARRLELRQDRVYGENPEYQAYIAKTPILLPFIPVYSVKKHKWLVA